MKTSLNSHRPHPADLDRLPGKASESLPRWRPLWLLLLCLVASPASLSAADFNVTSPGGFYRINNLQPNPTLTLVRGETYTFAVSTAANHPFRILSTNVVGNNTSAGIITFTVPMVASNYVYECSIHHFFGIIMTIPVIAAFVYNPA